MVRQKLPQDLRSIRIDHNNTSKQAPGPENRHSALYASIIAYLCLKRNKIFILLRSDFQRKKAQTPNDNKMMVLLRFAPG